MAIRRKLVWLVVGTLGAGLVVAASQAADPWREAIVGGIDPASLAGREASTNVYVRDSAAVVDRFALAERLTRQLEFAKAAELYQEIVERYADRVLPSQVDPVDNKIYQYASVQTAVQQRLSRWPAAGQEVYRRLYEPVARQLLESAPNDPATLHTVVERYFLTDSARDAAMRLFETYLESGEFSAASWIGHRLIWLHPSLGELRPLLLFKVSLSHHLAGDFAAARRAFETLALDHPDARALIAGEQVALVPKLLVELQKRPPTARDSGEASWPTFFGGNDRSRVPPEGTRRIVPTTRINAMPSSVGGGLARRELARRRNLAAADGQFTGLFPVIDSGQLFFQDNARVYGVNLASGLPLPGWASTHNSDPASAFKIDAQSSPSRQQHALALTDDRVLAVLGQYGMSGPVIGRQGPVTSHNTQLVCLDRQTGRRIWSVLPRGIELPGDGASLENHTFVGTPLVVGDSVFVQTQSINNQQFREAQLVCLSLSDGRVRWVRFLASSGLPQQFVQPGVGIEGNSSAGQLAYAGGRVFALTNSGVVASVDAFDGAIAWLNLYPQRALPNPNVRFRGQITSVSYKPFEQNPVIIRDGRVFVLPTDSDVLSIYDSATGVLVNQIDLQHFEAARIIVGVIDKKLLLAGENRVWCIDWTEYNPATFDPRSLEPPLVWLSVPLAGGIRGRPFLTEQAVYVPTGQGIRRIDLRTGSLSSPYPLDGQWPEGEGPGNILVLGDQLILAGADSIVVYTDPDVLIARIEQRLRDNPSDPLARVEFAELKFVMRDFEAAIDELDSARALIADDNQAARERLLGAALTFARQIVRDPQFAARQTSRLEVAAQMLDRAEPIALSPGELVQALLLRIELAALQTDAPTLLAAAQRILLDPRLRRVAVTDPLGHSAGQVARARIDRVLEGSNRREYQAYEAQARAFYALARQQRLPEALLAVADAYPNATIVPDLLADAADLFEQLDQPMRAAQVVRRLLTFDTLDEDRRLWASELAARAFLKIPGRLESSMAMLRSATRIRPDAPRTKPMLTPDGRSFDEPTLAEVLRAIRVEIARAQEQALPDIGLPLVSNQNRAAVQREGAWRDPSDWPRVGGIDQLLTTVGESRHDRVVARRGESVLVFSSQLGEPLMVIERIREPQFYFWVGDILVVHSRGLIVAADVANQKTLWGVDVGRLPQPDPMLENLAEETETEASDSNIQVGFDLRAGNQILRDDSIHLLRVTSDNVLVLTTQGRLICLSLAEGATRWVVAAGYGPAQRLEHNDDFVALTTTTNLGRLALIVAEIETGRLRTRAVPPPNGAIRNIAVAGDGMLVALGEDRILLMDLQDPQQTEPRTVIVHSNPNDRFLTNVRADQLVLADGRILAVSGVGNQQVIRGFGLDDGLPIRYPAGHGQRAVEARFTPSAASNFHLLIRVVGGRLYAINGVGIQVFNLESGQSEWRHGDAQARGQTRVIDTILTQSHVVNVVARNNNPQNPIGLEAYSRLKLPNGGESGNFDFNPNFSRDFKLQPRGPILPVQGGLVTLTAERELVVIQGKPLAAVP